MKLLRPSDVLTVTYFIRKERRKEGKRFPQMEETMIDSSYMDYFIMYLSLFEIIFFHFTLLPFSYSKSSSLSNNLKGI